MKPKPPNEGVSQAQASNGLPPSFARDTARLALTGKPKIDADTRHFESLIVALLTTVYGIALALVALIFGHREFLELLGLPLPRWGVLVVACLGFTALLRGWLQLSR
ncbi:MAG TPA: hypothetical protein VN693_00880 [Rhodanobacteraceae bacterium]|nr:hypothetical protein [Rhodanobacteraceae bacterium]